MSYKTLKSYNQTTVIYDFTVEFCDLYIDKRSRTYDQMVQAARSGKQNIPEGSAQRRPQGETMLTKVARGSQEELLEDYKDFLRQHGLPLWDKDSPQAQAVRRLAYREPYAIYSDYKPYLSSPEKAANAMICLINQTNYLLDHQIASQEKKQISGEVDGMPHEERLRRIEQGWKKEWREFIDGMIDKQGKVHTIRGVMTKEEAKKRGLEDIDPYHQGLIK